LGPHRRNYFRVFKAGTTVNGIKGIKGKLNPLFSVSTTRRLKNPEKLMIKIVTPLFFVLTLLVATPALAKSSAKETTAQSSASSTISKDWLAILLSFGSSTGDGPSTFFMKLFGYGGSTGEGPNTFFMELLGYGGTTGEGPSTFFMKLLGFGGSTGDGPNTF